jgi:glycosyltransferase involved in cell wall biosynthesis
MMLLFGPISPDVRVEKEAKTLSDNGFQVTILAWNRSGKLAAHEKRDGFSIHRMGPSLPASFYRLPRFGKFLVKAAVTVVFSIRVIGTALRANPEIIHAHDLDTLPIGAILKMVKPLGRVKLVYDSHEDYPAMLATDVGSWLGDFSRALERALLKTVDGVIASNHFIAARLSKYHSNVQIVTNAVDLEWFDECARHNFKLTETKPFVTYEGLVLQGRGLLTLIKARPFIRSQCTILVVGDGSYLDSLKEICRMENIQGVAFRGHVDHDVIPCILRQSSVGVLLFEPKPNNLVGVPNKLFEYGAASLPLLVSSLPVPTDFVRRHACGISVNEQDPEDVANAIDLLLANPSLRDKLGKNARNAVDRFYQWQRQRQLLLTFVESLEVSGLRRQKLASE